jgi:hypothetical protein
VRDLARPDPWRNGTEGFSDGGLEPIGRRFITCRVEQDMVPSASVPDSGQSVALDPGATVIVTVTCCGADRPARLVAAEGAFLTIGSVRCQCKRPLGVGSVVTLSWVAGDAMFSASATVADPATGSYDWRLHVEGTPRRVERRRFEREPDGRIGILWHGRKMVPVRVEDRSAGGFRCVAGGRANDGLRVGDTVRLRIANEHIAALRVVRARVIPGPQLELGLARV